ncbi:DUF3465 domain-containing protein [Acinetobacter sp. WZC-1]|uniref:DUF3465 domain-containing protein n=1 Tax=Acinetobacter sp. WZC-1 TaxID=3459034 RepID=UPI00403D973B
MANKTTVGIGIAAALLAAAYFGLDPRQQTTDHSQSPSVTEQGQASASAQYNANRNGLKVIRQAYERRASNMQVQAGGTVKAVLRDDNDGSRHQKFILSLENGLTVLVAHNIDLAPRIDHLQKGDVVEFYGEYEYSTQGGVIHWTHHDPQGQHENGWLKHEGKTYG